MTILVSTAYLDEGEKCDRLALMHNAFILDSSTPSEMRKGHADLEESIIARIIEVDKDVANDSFQL
jgi:ABC-type multidrug transport system ATPase subunit